MKHNGNIEYILKEVVARGANDNPSECNDFIVLLQRKDFKDLIAYELYESYFWDERHEFDLQILRELVERVTDFFNDPDTIMQIQSGFLQTLPSAIIISIAAFVRSKLKNIFSQKRKDEDSSWAKIERNIKKIDAEFAKHDYVLAEEIEQIFDTRREEIQPLLKLCGCKCYIDKKRSIWIKAGLPRSKVGEILKKHCFKVKYMK